MRTIWNGSISFGLVNIPIGLALATQRIGRVVPDAAPGVRHADQAEAVVPVPRARGRAGRAREGLGGREGRVRARRGVRSRVGRAPALAVDRDPPLRQARGRRPRLLRSHVLPCARCAPTRHGGRTCCCCARCRRRGWLPSASSCSGARRTSASIRAQGDTLAMETLFFAEDVRAKNEIEEAVEATEVQKAGAPARRRR